MNGDAASSLVSQPACSTAAGPTGQTGATAGTYTTSCANAASPNYNISYVSGSLKINPVHLIITASSPTITWGHAIPTITGSRSDRVGISRLAIPPTCSITATSSSGAGIYPTSCSGGSDPNYNLSYTSGH